ncbi:MAG: galactokinase family protein [Flavobacteriaceae bacterium]|nr:galactokinase family protein [Flavobacteriaceae bacterium]
MISKAPARICLFGDHQDYLGLPVIACAINKYMLVEGVPNNTNYLLFSLIDIDQVIKINLNEDFSVLKKGDHIRHVIKTLKKNNINIDKGYDIKISSDIFINAGISSSSALTVALIGFFIKIFDSKKNSEEFVAELAYQSEVVEQGGSGGRMDQYSISIGNTIFLETKTAFNYKKLNNPFKNFIIANSGVKKKTDLVLKNLKSKTISSIENIRLNNPNFNLNEISVSDVNKYENQMNKTSFRYFKAAVENHSITQAAFLELKKRNPNLYKLGVLMNRHHSILKNDLSITVPLIDKMIDLAFENGAYGAKIIGSGGGGSILILSNEKDENRIIKTLYNAGAKEVTKANESRGIFSL